MTVLQLVVILILIGVGLYVVNSVIPMDPKIKTIVNVVVVLLALLVVVDAFGIFDSFGHGHMRLR